MHRSIDRVWVSIGVPHVVKWSYLVWFPVESEILVKMTIFHTHLHSTPPLGATPNIVITFGTEWWGYHAEVEKVLRICLLISIQNTNDTRDIHRKSRFFSYPLHLLHNNALGKRRPVIPPAVWVKCSPITCLPVKRPPGHRLPQVKSPRFVAPHWRRSERVRTQPCGSDGVSRTG